VAEVHAAQADGADGKGSDLAVFHGGILANPHHMRRTPKTAQEGFFEFDQNNQGVGQCPNHG
jgi:hypothetical protein